MEILFSVLGFASAFLMALILNKMPAKAFCDYDETPDDSHNPPRVGKGALLISAVALSAVYGILTAGFGFCLKNLCFCFVCTILMMILLSDVRYRIIPDELIIAGCVLATVGVFPDILSAPDWAARLSPVFGVAIGAGIIFVINLLGHIFYQKDTLGMGDLKLMVVCGIICGTVGTVIAMLVGIFSAGLWFAVGIALKKVCSEEYMPLGPFLVFGTLFSLCFRPMIDQFLVWYISLF